MELKPYQKTRSNGCLKYHNNKVLSPWGEFDSVKEYNRYLVLKSLERSGKITDLKRQVSYELIPSQRKKSGVERPVSYRADFVYTRNGSVVVEDVKGFKTPEYVIKRKLMLFIHGIEISEV